MGYYGNGTNAGSGIDNRIINGDFLIDQRSASAMVTPASSQYVVDKWYASITAASKVKFQQTGAFATFTKSMTATSTSAYTILSSDSLTLQQKIEGLMVGDLDFGLSTAKVMILSFSAQASVAGTYCVTLQNSAANRSYPATFTLAAATATQVNLTIPGDTSGTWLTSNQTGINVLFDLGSGATFTGISNLWQAANYTTVSGCVALAANNAATLEITNVRLYPAAFPISNYTPRPYGEEFNLCRREFQTSFPSGATIGQGNGLPGALTSKTPIANGYNGVYVAFSPPMRTTPTIVTYNPVSANANWRDVTSSLDVNVFVDGATSIGSTGVLIASGNVTLGADLVAIHYTADAGL